MRMLISALGTRLPLHPAGVECLPLPSTCWSLTQTIIKIMGVSFYYQDGATFLIDSQLNNIPG
jgi:hypothetical protein